MSRVAAGPTDAQLDRLVLKRCRDTILSFNREGRYSRDRKKVPASLWELARDVPLFRAVSEAGLRG
jgi:hypothetical protein